MKRSPVNWNAFSPGRGFTKKARMNEVEALAREIRNRQRTTHRCPSGSKGPLTPDLLETMMKELEKLRQLLHTVMDALGRWPLRLPRVHQ